MKIMELPKSTNKNEDKINIRFLIYWVGQKCTLRCKNCCNLIPYCNQRSYSVYDCIEDLKKLTRIAKIQKFQIQGGETLTHPNIDVFIDEIGKMNFKEIELATNGTILLNKKTLEALKRNPNIFVRISNYKCCKKIRTKVLEQLEKEKIRYSVYSFMYGDLDWFDSGDLNCVRQEENETVQKTYLDCQNKPCWTLADGKLTTCGKIPILQQLKKDFYVNSYDEVEIRKIDNEEELKNQLNNYIEHYFDFKEHCRYCLGTNTRIEGGIQLKNKDNK